MSLQGTQVADMIDPVIYAQYIQEESSKVNRVVTSGAVAADPVMQAKIALADGAAFHLPSLINVSESSAGYAQSNDDPTSIATPDKITGRQQLVAVANRSFSWGSADLTASFAGTDPMRSAAVQAASKQTIERQSLLIKVLKGVIGSSLTNAVNDISLHGAGTPATANKISYGAIVDTTVGAWGDMFDASGLLFVPSAVYGSLIKQNLITFQPASVQNMGFGYYGGFAVMVDDTLPTAVDTGNTRYTCFIMKQGAVGFAMGTPKVPVEFYRRPDQGNGGGFEYLFIRDKFSFHPYGMSFTGTPAVASGVADTELALGTNWTPVFNRKLIGVVGLNVNV